MEGHLVDQVLLRGGDKREVLGEVADRAAVVKFGHPGELGVGAVGLDIRISDLPGAGVGADCLYEVPAVGGGEVTLEVQIVVPVHSYPTRS